MCCVNIEVRILCFSGNGKFLVLTDSMTKYVEISDCEVLPFPGITVKKLTDRIRFGQINVYGYSRILIHVGSNDLSNMIDSGRSRRPSIFDMMDRFLSLRNSIRRRNSQAVLLFSAVLPRVNRYKLFKAFIRGLNFAVEKMCAKSQGACIFIPCFDAFLSEFTGLPNTALFSERDGLHLDGAGVDKLEGIFQQALSTGYLFVRVRAERTRILQAYRY